jgi:hypothetical protein
MLSNRLRMDFWGIDQVINATSSNTYMIQILMGDNNPEWIRDLTNEEFDKLAQAVTLRLLNRFPNHQNLIVNVANEFGYHREDVLLRRTNSLEVIANVSSLVKNSGAETLINVDGVIPGLTTHSWDGNGINRRRNFEQLRDFLLERNLVDYIGLGGHFYLNDFINYDGTVNEEKINLVSNFVREQNQLGLWVIWTEADLRTGGLPRGVNEELAQALVAERLANIFLFQEPIERESNNTPPAIVFYGSTENWLGRDEDATPWTQPDGQRKPFYYSIIKNLLTSSN